MSRPPYLRRIAAVLVVLVAVAIEFRPTTTQRLAIATTDLVAGTTVTEADVAWVDVSKGAIEPAVLPAIVSRMVPAGAPISDADVDSGSVEVPADWLQIELEVPAATQNGATVVAVMSPALLDRPATGLVTRVPEATGFDGLTALVAFDPTDAVAVAHAVAEGTVTVLLGR
jgi:hypothetical protein